MNLISNPHTINGMLRAKIKLTYRLKSYRGKTGTIIRDLQFNKAYFKTDEPMATVLIDRDYLEVLSADQ